MSADFQLGSGFLSPECIVLVAPHPAEPARSGGDGGQLACSARPQRLQRCCHESGKKRVMPCQAAGHCNR